MLLVQRTHTCQVESKSKQCWCAESKFKVDFSRNWGRNTPEAETMEAVSLASSCCHSTSVCSWPFLLGESFLQTNTNKFIYVVCFIHSCEWCSKKWILDTQKKSLIGNFNMCFYLVLLTLLGNLHVIYILFEHNSVTFLFLCSVLIFPVGYGSL